MAVFLNLAIVAPAYTPEVKPKPPFTRFDRLGDYSPTRMPYIAPALAPKPVPLHFKQYKRGATVIPYKPYSIPRKHRAAFQTAMERRLAERKFKAQIRKTTPGASGFSVRPSARNGLAAAGLLAAELAMHIDSMPVAQAVVEAERQERKNKSMSCVSAFGTLHAGFVEQYNHYQAIFDIGIKTDDAAPRRREKRTSRRNPKL